MLTQEEAVEISALLKRRWTVSAMARHLGRDRKTVRAYIKGERQPGRRKPVAADWFAPFVEYIAIRMRDDPHLWASALNDELQPLGFPKS